MDICLLVIDVDGVLTDGGIYYSENGDEIKKFSTRDGAGFFAAKEAGIKTMILTGRESKIVSRRMKELKADYVMQGVFDKKLFLEKYIEESNLTKENVAYIGDDLIDIPPMSLCGFTACPCDASKEVKSMADYCSPVCGGKGVLRDVVEYLLGEEQWKEITNKIYNNSGR